MSMRYLVVTYAQQANGKYNENVKIDDRIRNRDQNYASVILDYQERKVVKCRLDASVERNFDNISNFYKQHYAQAIEGLEAKFQVLEEAKETLLAGIKEPEKEEVQSDTD